MSHWSIVPSTTSLQDIKQKHRTIKYRSLTYTYLMRSMFVSHWSILPTMIFIHQIILKILSKITRPWSIDHVDLYLFWGQSLGHTIIIIWKYDTSSSNNLENIRQNHWTMKYRSQCSTFILWSNARSYWSIIPKYDVHTSNSFQDITQNHWTMKYRSQWPTFIFKSNVGSYWLIIPNNDVHTPNSLQDIRQNHWTIKYR